MPGWHSVCGVGNVSSGLCLPQARLSPSWRSGGPRAIVVRTGGAGRHCAGPRDYHDTIQSLDEVLGLESALEQAMPAAHAGDMAQLTVMPQAGGAAAAAIPVELHTSARLAAEQSARHEKLQRRQAQLRQRQQELEKATSRHSKAAYWHQQRASQLQRRLGQLAAEQMQLLAELDPDAWAAQQAARRQQQQREDDERWVTFVVLASLLVTLGVIFGGTTWVVLSEVQEVVAARPLCL